MKTIVYFDGVCGLCNASVNFLIVRDREGRLHYAPLQGATALSLPIEDRESLNSLVVATPQGLLRRSDGVVYLLKQLPGVWPMVGRLLGLIPRFLRDFGYRVVSRYRYRLFGKHDTCRLPTPEERDRFLP